MTRTPLDADAGSPPGKSTTRPPVMIEPVARPPVRRRIRPDAVWAAARSAWEGGETARSVALRYDVGVPALWKRREAEGWKRPDPEAGPVEPVEGWDRYAAARRQDFEVKLEAVRELALDLVEAMAGGPVTTAPLWHLSFLFSWRAQHLGAEVAAADRDRSRDKPWASFWDEDGRLRSQTWLDAEMMRLHRGAWREEAGLPEGAAPLFP